MSISNKKTKNEKRVTPFLLNEETKIEFMKVCNYYQHDMSKRIRWLIQQDIENFKTKNSNQ